MKSKKDLKIYSVNPLYLYFEQNEWIFEEINGNNYLALAPTNKTEDKIKTYEELLIKIGDLIRPVTKSQMIMMKNIWESNLIQMKSYL